MRQTMLAILLTGLLLLVPGCGGGGGANPAPADTVSGVAAAGLVITGTVYLKDSAAAPRELSATTTDGKFSFDVTGLTKPFLLRVVGTVAGGSPQAYTLYSLAGDKGTANINPMSNLLVANAAGSGDLAALYAASDRSGLPGIADNLAQALSDTQATLKPLLQKYGVAAVDPIKDPYQADGSGLDHMLDLVQIVVDSAGGSVTITDTGSAPVTKTVATGFATRAVSGSATLDGAPLAGVTVTVADAATGTVYGSATTLADGGYLIGDVAQGSVSVSAAKAGYSFDQASVSLTVAGSDCVVPAFHSSKPFTVSGTVSSSNGSGLAGVTVSVQRAGAQPRSAITDGNGKYAIGGLSNGSYSVTPTRTDIFHASAVSFDALSKGATLSDAGNYAQVNFTAGLASFTVSGQVTRLSSGAAMAGITLTLVSKTNANVLSTSSDAIFSTVSDAQGNYSLSGIPVGYYALNPTLTDFAFALSGATDPAATADNFMVNGATRMDFTGRPTSDATGGVSGI